MKITNILWGIFSTVILVATLVYIYFQFFSSLDIWPRQSDVSPAQAALADYNSGNIDDAIVKGESIASGNQKDIPALLLLATSYAEKGSVAFDEENYGQKAIDTANAVLDLDPENSEAYRIIGYADEIMDNFDDARVNYGRAIDLDPNNSQAYSNMGHSYDLQGDPKNAESWYKKALAVNPNNEHALLNEARLQAGQSKFEDAKKTLARLESTSMNKRFIAEGQQILAFVYMNQPEKDYANAYVAIQKSISYDNTLPQAFVTRGFIDLYTILDSESKEAYDAKVLEIDDSVNKALALNPNQASAYYLAFQAAKGKGDTALANDMKAKALAAIPRDITLGTDQKQSLKDSINAVTTKAKK